MQVSTLGGIKNEDNTRVKQDNIYVWYKANGAISIGAPVALDESATTDYVGVEVIEADGDNPYHLCRGIYNWNCDSGKKSGSWETLASVNAAGSAASGTALAGYAAADGDWIGVQVYGVGIARAVGTTNIARGDPLAPGTGAGVLVISPTSPEHPADNRVMFTALRALTLDTTEVGIAIDIACM